MVGVAVAALAVVVSSRCNPPMRSWPVCLALLVTLAACALWSLPQAAPASSPGGPLLTRPGCHSKGPISSVREVGRRAVVGVRL
jgi:hypothetical protein